MFAQGVKDLYEIVNFSVIINQLTTHFLYHRSIKLLYFIIWTPCNCSKVSKIFAEVYTVSAYETLTALLKKNKYYDHMLCMSHFSVHRHDLHV